MARPTVHARESSPILSSFASHRRRLQLSRSVSDLGTKPIYPWPRQIFAPNNEYSQENTATIVAKNKERALMETTYRADYNGTDGLGSHVVFDTTVPLAPTEKLVRRSL